MKCEIRSGGLNYNYNVTDVTGFSKTELQQQMPDSTTRNTIRHHGLGPFRLVWLGIGFFLNKPLFTNPCESVAETICPRKHQAEVVDNTSASHS